jgi:hypothetical protein
MFLGFLEFAPPKPLVWGFPAFRGAVAASQQAHDSGASDDAALKGRRDVLLVAIAMAEGTKAIVAIHRALLKEDGLG